MVFAKDGEDNMEKQIKSLSRKRKILTYIIYTFCSIVSVCVISVLLFKLNPSQNAPGALGSACMDIVSMLVLLILVISLTTEKEMMGRTSKLFLALMLGTKWALFFDFLTWSLDGSLEYDGWTYLFTVASLCSGAILGAVFVMYLSSYLDDMYNLKKTWLSAKVCFVCNIVAFVLTFVLAITKTAFVFVDGHYVVGALYDVITVLPILTLIYMCGYAIAHVKIIGIHDAIAVAVYIFIMIIGAVMEAVLGVGTTYVAVSIADVFIFVMLQNKLIDRAEKQKDILTEKIDEEKKKVEKWMYRSNIDEVTGFLNRHAYEGEIASLKKNGVSDDFVYVSMDVNSLKVVNDTLGHEAGDELIVGACTCMKQCFGKYGKLYRIGGDEFVALINVEPSMLDKTIEKFNEDIRNWRGKLVSHVAISAGYVTKAEAENMSLHQMAVLADKRMYESKTKFYQNKGVDRRGQKDAHVALCGLYSKILRINLTNDTYQIVDMDESEMLEEKGFSPNLSGWLREFASHGQVHPEDVEEYYSKTDTEYLREYFANNNSFLRIFYRRKFGEVYRKVMMEIIPTNDYRENSQSMFLYVKDIEQ